VAPVGRFHLRSLSLSLTLFRVLNTEHSLGHESEEGRIAIGENQSQQVELAASGVGRRLGGEMEARGRKNGKNNFQIRASDKRAHELSPTGNALAD